MDALRHLDFDHLFVLRHLLHGSTVTAVALRMGLTQPAVTQRIRKLERAFGTQLLEKSGRRVRLSRDGRRIAEQAIAALQVLDSIHPAAVRYEVTVGSRPEVAASWLWPALLDLRARHPEHAFHCYIGAGDEILRLLDGSSLDLIVTSAPHVARTMVAIDVAREDYVCAAAPAIARRTRTLADLRDQTWIEHDRSFPFLRYLPAADRAALTCKEVWFTGSTTAMVSALVAGHGVGVVPEYLARPALRAGRLRRCLSQLVLGYDRFRILRRADRDVGDAAALLRRVLIERGLQ